MGSGTEPTNGQRSLKLEGSNQKINETYITPDLNLFTRDITVFGPEGLECNLATWAITDLLHALRYTGKNRRELRKEVLAP